MRFVLFLICGLAFAQADRAAPRTDANSRLAHEQLLAKKTQGRIDVYFEGDSITRRWGATDYPQFLEHFRASFFGWNAADFGWGADRIENILWRLENGELDGVNPKVIVLLAGTNNIGNKIEPGSEDALVEDVSRGLAAVVRVMREKAPGAVIVATGIFPRYDNPAALPVIERVNANLAKLADGKSVRYLNVNAKMSPAMLNADGLHPALAGYQVWADGLRPILTEILGAPAAVDLAPAPTGDPSAKR